MKSPYTFIFMGRSGCGKGTQARLLDQFIKDTDKEARGVLYIETGARFREFISRKGYTPELAKAVAEKGKRQPDFLAVWMWSHVLVEEYKGGEHLIIDGSARSQPEAKIWETVFEFYGRPKPVVVYLNVSREWSKKHLLARGRADDSAFDIDERLNWFDRDTVPAIEYFKTSPFYDFLEVNGEQSIEDIHKQITEKVFSTNA